MKRILLPLLCLLLSMSVSAQNVNIIPQPRELKVNQGEYGISDLTAFYETLDNLYAAIVDGQPAMDEEAGIVFRCHASDDFPAEGYRLTINAEGIQVEANSQAGFSYAQVTLRQLVALNSQGGRAKLPYVEICDASNFAHRGFMLDVSRHFFDKEEVKKMLDLMHYYKLNRFHWHLTDDQGWRIEIPEYPRLTEVGAVRDSSLTNKGRQPFFYDDTRYGEGMYFTLDDLREIVAYAKNLHIEIIPEVDLPGHMVAAVAAYPELGCNPTQQVSVRVHQGVSKEVLNVGDDHVIDFLKCVLSHLCEVFPYPYIHLGGDECPTDQWRDNPLCLQRVADNGLSGVDELQSWLVEELGSWLKTTYGRDIIVWDELLAHWNDSNSIRPIIMCWRGLDFTEQAAARGFQCISVPNYPMYLDLIQMKPEDADVCAVYQGGYGTLDDNTVEGIYRRNPVARIAGREQYCIGTQANLWTESCSSNAQAEYQMLPRLLAVAENGWLSEGEKDWTSFYQRLQSHDEILDVMGYTYARHYFEPTERTPLDSARVEAQTILRESRVGQPGYPAAKQVAKLRRALSSRNLPAALAAYKQAPVALPIAGTTYRIVSASSWYLAKYEGSTLYAKEGEGLHLHYTPQHTEAEEWLCEAEADGRFTFVNVANPQVRIAHLSIEKAVQPVPGYNYRSGTLLLRQPDGRVLEATSSGTVTFGTDELLCHPGTWRILPIDED